MPAGGSTLNLELGQGPSAVCFSMALRNLAEKENKRPCLQSWRLGVRMHPAQFGLPKQRVARWSIDEAHEPRSVQIQVLLSGERVRMSSVSQCSSKFARKEVG